jgi:hypothetical protein
LASFSSCGVDGVADLGVSTARHVIGIRERLAHRGLVSLRLLQRAALPLQAQLVRCGGMTGPDGEPITISGRCGVDFFTGYRWQSPRWTT